MFDERKAKTLALNLINKGVDINLMDNNGLTPLLVAIKKSQLKALEFALQYNLKNPKTHQFNFNQRAKKNFTALHYSVLKCNHESFLFLLQ